MPKAEVIDRVQKVLEQHSQTERMMDAYWQWATNPTPPSAGYALVENGGFIATNLMVRYGESCMGMVQQLAAECQELRREDSVYDLQQAIVAVLNGPAGEILRQGVLARLSEPTPQRQLLCAWVACRSRWQGRPGREHRVGGEFDWSLGIDLEASHREIHLPFVEQLFGTEGLVVDLPREALAAGIVNRLFYRNAAGRMEPKMRPGPRIPLQTITY
jgi:hypothetical protein